MAKIQEHESEHGPIQNLLVYGTHRSSKAVAELLTQLQRKAEVVQVDEAHNLKRFGGAPALDEEYASVVSRLCPRDLFKSVGSSRIVQIGITDLNSS